jgi:multidrug resistance efflux pump
MTPDQKFALWVKYACIIFVILFAYFLFADMSVPLTPQAMATHIVTKVAPRVSGQVIRVNVHNNQAVRQGDVLFEIDPALYQLAVEQAQLNLDKAIQDFQQLNASITAMRAKLKAQRIITQQKQREAKRLSQLFAHNGVSQQQLDDAVSSATAAEANLSAAKATLKELIVRRGSSDTENLEIRAARNRLKQAQLNLSYTRVKAEHSGIITNLQLTKGAAAQAGQPMVALVDTDLDIIADFREKSLHDFPVNSRVLVTFDGNPGRIYQGTVADIDAGVSNGQFNANGTLASPTTSNRWVRNAQRLRLHLKLIHSDRYTRQLASGSRATVQLVPQRTVLAWLAWLQIKALGLLHYIY